MNTPHLLLIDAVFGLLTSMAILGGYSWEWCLHTKQMVMPITPYLPRRSPILLRPSCCSSRIQRGRTSS